MHAGDDDGYWVILVHSKLVLFMMARLFLKAGMKEYDFGLKNYMHLSILFHHFGTQIPSHLAKYSYEYIQEYFQESHTWLNTLTHTKFSLTLKYL